MTITIIASPTGIAQAFEAGRAAGLPGIKGAAAPVSAAILGLVDEAWSVIDRGLADAYKRGKDVLDGAVDGMVKTVETIIARAGATASEVHRMILQKLSAFTQTLVRATLSQIAPKIEVGDAHYALDEVKWTQKLVVGGSLKASLTEVVETLASGEFQIEASYTRAKP